MFIINDTIKDTIIKAIADANPTHYGIFISPMGLPFLFISFPKISFFNIYYAIFGINFYAIKYVINPFYQK